MRWWAWPVALLGGCVLALIVVFSGPRHMVVCTEAGWPDSVFGDSFGHTDGAAFTGCDVPTTATYLVALVFFVAPLAAVVIRRRIERRRVWW